MEHLYIDPFKCTIDSPIPMVTICMCERIHQNTNGKWERSCSVEEGLTRNRGVVVSSLTGGTVLCP